MGGVRLRLAVDTCLSFRAVERRRVTAVDTEGPFTLNVASAGLRPHSLCMWSHHTESSRRPRNGGTRLPQAAFGVNRPVGPHPLRCTFSVTAEKMLL